MSLGSRRRFVLGTVIATAVVGSALVTQAPAAEAVVKSAVVGPLTVTNVVGSQDTASTFRFATDRACPANDGGNPATATNFVSIAMSGGDVGHQWSDVTLVGSTSSGVSHVGAQEFQISDTFANIAAGDGLPLPLGTYTVTLQCQDAFATAVSATFQARLTFSGAVSPATDATFVVEPPIVGALGVSGTSTPATVTDTFDFTTQGPCPTSISGTSTNFVSATMSGGSAGHVWTDAQLVTSTSSGVSHVSGLSIPISDTFANIAASNSLPSPLGNYVITMTCQNGLGTSVSGVFTTPISFTAAVPPSTATTFSLNNAYSSSTALQSSAPTVTIGTPLTLTATVSVAGGVLPAGTVTFSDGAGSIGTPQPVAGGANNTAAVTVSTLSAGVHSVSATFTPSNAASPADQYTASTSSSVSVTVIGRPSAPRSASATPGNRSVTVRWLAPLATGGSPIQGYTVSATPKVGSSTRTCSAAASARTCLVSGLVNGVGYRFTVVARNTAGAGTVATSAVVVPSAPLAVSWTKSGAVLSGTFTKVTGATNYRITSVGAKVGTGSCRAVGSKEKCSITLRKGTSTVSIAALNRAGLPLAKASRVQKV